MAAKIFLYKADVLESCAKLMTSDGPKGLQGVSSLKEANMPEAMV